MLFKGSEVLTILTLMGHRSHMGVLASTFGHMHVDLFSMIQAMHALVILSPPIIHLLTLKMTSTVRRDQAQMILYGMGSSVIV